MFGRLYSHWITVLVSYILLVMGTEFINVRYKGRLWKRKEHQLRMHSSQELFRSFFSIIARLSAIETMPI